MKWLFGWLRAVRMTIFHTTKTFPINLCCVKFVLLTELIRTFEPEWLMLFHQKWKLFALKMLCIMQNNCLKYGIVFVGGFLVWITQSLAFGCINTFRTQNYFRCKILTRITASTSKACKSIQQKCCYILCCFGELQYGSILTGRQSLHQHQFSISMNKFPGREMTWRFQYAWCT